MGSFGKNEPISEGILRRAAGPHVGEHDLQRAEVVFGCFHDRNGRDARSTYGGRDARAAMKGDVLRHS